MGFTTLGPGLGCTKIKLGTGIWYHPPSPFTILFYNGKCDSIIDGSQGNIQIHDNLTSKVSPNVSRTIDTRTYSRSIYDIFLSVRFARLIYFSRDQLSSMVIDFLDSKHARVNSRVTELDLKLDSRNFGGSSRVDLNGLVHLFGYLYPRSQNESICQTFLQ